MMRLSAGLSHRAVQDSSPKRYEVPLEDVLEEGNVFWDWHDHTIGERWHGEHAPLPPKTEEELEELKDQLPEHHNRAARGYVSVFTVHPLSVGLGWSKDVSEMDDPEYEWLREYLPPIVLTRLWKIK